MRKIWVVESGEYSAYAVHCAAESKEHAEAIAAHMGVVDARYREKFDVTELFVYEEGELPQRGEQWSAGIWSWDSPEESIDARGPRVVWEWMVDESSSSPEAAVNAMRAEWRARRSQKAARDESAHLAADEAGLT